MGSEPRFFVLAPENIGGAWDTYGEMALGFETADGWYCPKCGTPIGSRVWLPPYRIELMVHGTEGAGDLVRFVGGDFLVSERMADAYHSEGLTGLGGFHLVEVVKRNARAKRLGTPKYLLVNAAYGRTAVDEAGSRIRRSKPIECDECRSTGVDGIYGFRIQPGTWDRLDVFHPRGLQGDIVASERFADFIRRHGFTNLQLTPTEAFVWDPLRKGPPPQASNA